MPRALHKEAAGELTARFARWLSTPIPGTPKLVQKLRSGPELDVLEHGVRAGADKYVTAPLRQGLKKIRADRAMAGMASPFVGPERAKAIGERAVELVAQKPHVALGMVSPVPGLGVAMQGMDMAKNRFLNATPGLKVKVANGDMLQYFMDHPQKLKEKQERDRAKERRKKEKTAAVAPYQQRTQHTCSAACLSAVLGHYGFDADEHDLAQLIGVRQRGGAETDQIAAAARRLGLACFEYSFESLEQAKILTDQNIPIIADIQSFNRPGSGHYVVITNIDPANVYVMDPNTPGNQRVLSWDETAERWWDRAMKPPHQLMKMWGIIVLPPEGT